MLVEHVERNMQGGIAERADAEHAPDVDQLPEPRDAAQRRDGEGDDQQHQRPEAGAVDEVVDRPRPGRDRLGVPGGERQRQQQQRQRRNAKR